MAKQRLNIDIEASLWKEVGIRAIQEGINKKDLVEKALVNYLANQDRKLKEVDAMKNKTTKEVIEILEEITREVADIKGMDFSDKEFRDSVSGSYETVSEEELGLSEQEFRTLYKEWMLTTEWGNKDED